MVGATQEEQIGLNSPADSPVGTSRTQTGRDSILLVEDDIPTLRLERVILEEAGYLVEGVVSGEAALKLIAEEPPALVILDNQLPGMDGFTTCRRIREFSQVPVVLVTGSKSAADRKQGRASGADIYITKPFLADKLVDLVGEFIAQSAGYPNDAEEGEGEGSQPVQTSPPDPQPANAPMPNIPVIDVRDPIAESASLPAEDGAQPDSNRPADSAFPWHGDDSPASADEEEPEDDPAEVSVVWDSLYSQQEQSPLEEPDFEDALSWYGGEPAVPSPGHPSRDVNQPAPVSAVAFHQGKSSAASSLEEQGAGPADQSEADSPFSPPALPAGDLAETANEDKDPDPTPADEPANVAGGGLYEGTVRLMVTSSGPVKNLLNFVGELRQNTQLRLLRLVASQRSESMDIWLGLREPLHLIQILEDIPGVSQVTALPDSGDPVSGGPEEERRVTVAVG